MEGHIAATYTLVHRFLKQQSQNKAAEAVKKAAKNVVVLRDDIEPEGPPLEDIIRQWKQSQGNTKAGDESSSSSEDSDSSDDETSSESEDSSSADSSSEDTSDSEDDGTNDVDEESPAEELRQKPVERDTSATLSSAEEKKEAADQLAKIVGILIDATEDKDEDTGSDSSNSSDSDSSSQSSPSDSSDAESSSNSSDSSSNSSESNDEHVETPTKPPPSKPKGKQPSPSESSSSESSPESEEESDSESERQGGEHIAKKRKISESGTAMAPSISQPAVGQRKEKPPPKVKERFQRVKIQNIAPKTLLNNGYDAKGGVTNDYGERAHRDLMVTRGAGFRKEKNKKKRGSYRGGDITMENHSIKFDF